MLHGLHREKHTAHIRISQGSVFVEFADMKSAQDFLNADPKPSWDGKELLIMSKYDVSLSEFSLSNGL